MANRLLHPIYTADTQDIQNLQVADIQQIQTDWDCGADLYCEPDLVPASSHRRNTPRQTGSGTLMLNIKCVICIYRHMIDI